MRSPLELSRIQILAFRRKAGALDARMPAGAKSLRRAAWAGLQDSVPRAALLSMHARLRGVKPDFWEHSSLVQLWGPRFNVYVVAEKDLPIFSLGRLPEDAKRLARAQTTADRLRVLLKEQRMPFAQAGRAIGMHHNSLRYAAPTSTVLLRWDGARQPVIRIVAASLTAPLEARLELARRYLRVFGPSTAAAFATWAGIRGAEAAKAFVQLAKELEAVRTPIGDAWILAEDEAALLAEDDEPPAPARLLPSGDAYYLLWGADRELLIPDAKRRAMLWTTRVWPGALLVNGEIVGVWRRSAAEISVEAWRSLSAAEREAVEAEAASLPLTCAEDGAVQVRWA